MRERVDLKSPVRENRPPGSVRGAPGNRRPYRDSKRKSRPKTIGAVSCHDPKTFHRPALFWNPTSDSVSCNRASGLSRKKLALVRALQPISAR